MNDTIEVAGPDRMPMSALVERYLRLVNDPRQVVTDPDARYFGGRIDDRSLVPGGHARLGRIRLEDWIEQSKAPRPTAGHA